MSVMMQGMTTPGKRKKGMHSSEHKKSVFGQFMDDLDGQHDEDESYWGLDSAEHHGKTGCRMG